MIGILVITLGSIQRNAGRVLFGEARYGGGFAWMHLNRQRLIGAQHFEQERQLAETTCDFGTQLLRLIFINNIAQRAQITVGTGYARAALRVSPHPQFRHRQSLWVGNAIQLG
ncbi:hypothetical protein D3C71_1825760 [compost metagenome]